MILVAIAFLSRVLLSQLSIESSGFETQDVPFFLRRGTFLAMASFCSLPSVLWYRQIVRYRYRYGIGNRVLLPVATFWGTYSQLYYNVHSDTFEILARVLAFMRHSSLECIPWVARTRAQGTMVQPKGQTVPKFGG